MLFTKTYQEVDSSTLQPPFLIEEKDELNGLELIEEVDESIDFLKPKKNYFTITKLDSTGEIDTLYGIKNEQSIPIRKITTTTKEEKPIEKLFSPSLVTNSIASWQIIILIITVFVLGIVKAFSNNRFKQSIKALFNYGVAQEITREEKVFFHRSTILLTIIHLLTTALFLYHIRELFNSVEAITNKFVFFLLIVGFLMVVYTLKYIFSKILLFIFNDSSIAAEYIFNVSLYNNLLGVVFIPILCLTYFSSLPFSLIFVYIAIPLILLLFSFRLIRMYIIGITKGVSYFYIFLYICTLEILPLVVLYRIFIIK